MQKVSSSITLSIYAPIADGLLWVVPSCDFSSLFPIVKILLGIKWQFEMNVNIMFGDVMAVLYSIAFLLMELKANSTASIYSRWYRSNIVWMCTSVPVSWRKHTCNAPATFLRSFFVTCITAFRAIWHITSTTLTNKQMTFKDPMMMIRMSWRQEFYANYLCQILIVQNLLFLWLSLPAPKCLHMRFICTYLLVLVVKLYYGPLTFQDVLNIVTANLLLIVTIFPYSYLLSITKSVLDIPFLH